MIGTKTHGWVHLAEYPLEDVLQNTQIQRIFAHGAYYIVRANGSRNRLLRKSRKCACCGCKATLALLDTYYPGSRIATFNIYAVVNGKLRLMTRDHIKPRSCGGNRRPDNLQLLCEHCNQTKADRIIALEELRSLVCI